MWPEVISRKYGSFLCWEISPILIFRKTVKTKNVMKIEFSIFLNK